MDNLLIRLAALKTVQSSSLCVKRPKPRILYFVSHSYPFSSDGYAVRTHGVATGLFSSGCEVIVAIRPGFPWDVHEGRVNNIDLVNTIDDINYVFTSFPKREAGSLNKYLHDSVEVIKELIRVFKPSLALAASNWHNALPVSIAAHELAIPFYYEVRGFWEISHLAKYPAWRGSNGFDLEVKGETAVAKSAKGLFTLNRFMKQELVRRGLAEERISLVPNGIPNQIKEKNKSITREEIGIASPFVVGYVGSFNVYEGLDDLIKAISMVLKKGFDVSLVLVGSGQPVGVDQNNEGLCEKSNDYQELANQLGIGNHLFMPGRVDPQLITAYYELIDLVVIPRKPLSVCELVSPMKPLEAAVQGKCVLMSDVAPLAELTSLSNNFRLYEKGSVSDLAAKIEQSLSLRDTFNSDHEKLTNFTWANNVTPMVSEFNRCTLS